MYHAKDGSTTWRINMTIFLAMTFVVTAILIGELVTYCYPHEDNKIGDMQ